MPTHRKTDTFRRQLLTESFPKEWETWLSANRTHYHLLRNAERARLQDDARVMIAEKTWEGCDGLNELMKLTVAAQAALLLMGLNHDYFSRVLSVVLFPTAFEMP